MIKPIQVSFSKKILIFILFLLLFLTSIILADGCFKGPSPAVPGIPYQSAIIRYKDGEETLIIQSYLESDEGSNFGWIIPLPEKPSSVKAFSPGVFKCLPFCFYPEIKYPETTPYTLTILFLIIILITCYFRTRTGCQFLIAFIFLLLIMAVSVPNFLGAREGSGSVTGIKTLKSGIAGNYEFSILEADNSKALDKWLKKNELHTLEDNEKKVVDDYISEEWVFAVARINRNEKEKISAAHPISFKFKTDKPVYPMRLTGLASKLPYLYLYIISDEKADINGYTNMFSDKLKYEKGVDWSSKYPGWISKSYWEEASIEGVWRSESYRFCWIVHPAFQPLLYEGCFLTVLAAKTDKSHVKNDAYINFSGNKPERLTFYRKSTIVRLSYLKSIILILSVFLIYLIIWRIFRRKWKTPLWVYPLAILLVFLFSPLFKSHYTSSEDWNVDASEVRVDYIYYMPELLAFNLYEDSVKPSQMTEKELDNVNPYTDKKFIKEDSPGNFTLRKNEKGEWVLTMYDLNGTPYDQIFVDKK
jgi:uncharacterized protein DUF2330